MGIPGFYYALRKSRHGVAFRKEKPKKTHILAIDLNGVIHQVAQRVFGYGTSEMDITVEKYFDQVVMSESEFNQKLQKLAQDIWSEIIQIVITVGPTEQIILAVDGVAPQAKITQQRKRRYRSAADRPKDQIFDSTVITPGTTFMAGLDQFLQQKLASVYKDPQVGPRFPPNIVYSSYQVPGEGEHKIADHVRKMINVEKKTMVIDGLDADLFMIYLLQVKKFDRILLRRGEEYLNLAKIDVSNPDDLVIKVFLIGNDFLPKFPGFTKVEGVLSRLFDDTTHLIERPGQISWPALQQWFASIETFYAEELKKWALTATGIASRSFDTIQAYGAQQGIVRNWNQTRFDKDWYRHIADPLGSKFDVTESDKEKICHAYLQGINWVYTYYRFGFNQVNARWYYPYQYAPVFADISAYLLKHQDTILQEVATVPNQKKITMLEKLVMVVPPRSSSLLPAKYRFLFTKESPIYDICPQEFFVDTTGGGADHEAVVLIPIVNPTRVGYALEFVAPLLDDPVVNDKAYFDPGRIMMR